MATTRTLRIVPLALGLLLLAGCAGTSSSVKSQGPWLEPSPRLRQQIEDNAKRLPWTHGMDRIELIRWFATVGEPAYPTLLDMVEDPRPDVAGAAMAALGATRDSRLVEPLRAIPWPSGDEARDLRLERARTLLQLGDWNSMPHLIEGLRDERLLTRALCAQALWEATRERFDYDPKADPAERDKSIQRWDAWYKERSGDPMQQDRAPKAASNTSERSRSDDQ